MTATILTVDDSASMRQMVSFTLKRAGYTVVEAADGVEALNYARTSAVDLVLTDVNMPNMDGISLVRELRQLQAYKFVPMLMLTTESGQDKKMLGKAAGAGVEGHLHMHALPRWLGDSNFMTTIAETRILPEDLATTWRRLRDAFAAVR